MFEAYVVLTGVLIIAVGRLTWDIGWYLVERWNERA